MILKIGMIISWIFVLTEDRKMKNHSIIVVDNYDKDRDAFEVECDEYFVLVINRSKDLLEQKIACDILASPYCEEVNNSDLVFLWWVVSEAVQVMLPRPEQEMFSNLLRRLKDSGYFDKVFQFRSKVEKPDLN